MQPQFITIGRDAKDITGQRFGRLVALGPIGRYREKTIVWLCQCDCGDRISVDGVSLRGGNTQSCGCLCRERAAFANTTHGMSCNPLYTIWVHLIDRCCNPNAKYWVNYGGRGITVDGSWRHDFQVFFNDVSKLPHYREKGYSLDRIDNDGNYEPGNIKWSTRSEQMRNTRSNHLLTHNGKTQTIVEWAEEIDMKPQTLRARLGYGWTAERALTTPLRRW